MISNHLSLAILRSNPKKAEPIVYTEIRKFSGDNFIMAGQFHPQMIGRYKHPTKIFWDKEPTRLKKLLNKTRQNTQEAVSNK